MKIAVTGASGFVGRHVVRFLLRQRWLKLVAMGRDAQRLKELDCPFVVHDLRDSPAGCYEQLGCPDVLIHLAWDHLDDYDALEHIDETFGASYRLIRAMVDCGTGTVVCAGTCLEYGMAQGQRMEDEVTDPVTAYGIAKDSLRRTLECLQRRHSFVLRWLRLFYMYGAGQREQSLIAQLDRCLDRGEAAFRMSGGEQLRDYAPVETVGEYVARAALQDEVDGIINVCSGRPVSVRSLVEQRMLQRGRTTKLELGHYSYPAHEPLAFWGDAKRIQRVVAASERYCREAAESSRPELASRRELAAWSGDVSLYDGRL